jgi:hypothetical protein
MAQLSPESRTNIHMTINSKIADKDNGSPAKSGKPSLKYGLKEESLDLFFFVAFFVVPDFLCGCNAGSDKEIACAFCGGVRAYANVFQGFNPVNHFIQNGCVHGSFSGLQHAKYLRHQCGCDKWADPN